MADRGRNEGQGWLVGVAYEGAGGGGGGGGCRMPIIRNS